MKIQKRGTLSSILALSLSLCMSLGTVVCAEDTLDKAQQKAKDFEKQKEQLGKEQTQAEEALEDLILDMQGLSDDIDDKQAELKEEEERFAEAKVRESNQYMSMKKRIKFMYEAGQSQNMLEVLLKSENFADFINKVEYCLAISVYDRDMLEKFKAAVEDSRKQEEALKEEYKNMAVMQGQLIEKQDELQSIIDEKDNQLSELDAKIAENEALIRELLEKAEEEKRRREEELARSQNSGTAYVSPDGSYSTSESGYFAHPCPGAPISSPFGYRDFDCSFHKGVDFAAPEWTPTYAAADGTVVIAGWSGSAGNWVVINHGSGLVTKYMHHIALCVEEGQYVIKGQQIGYVGNTGYSYGAHLHFQVEQDSVPVDPMGYL